MTDYLIGEDGDLVGCGLKAEWRCRICEMLMGATAAELLTGSLREISMSQIQPLLDYHMRKAHGIKIGENS